MRNTKSEYVTDVKTLMSKQYNKAEKRKRRLRYLKRKQLAVKKKKAEVAKAPPPV
ncbi:MAG: hypothetical protein ABSD57_02860 [Verrucomicrobiota bacterium]